MTYRIFLHSVFVSSIMNISDYVCRRAAGEWRHKSEGMLNGNAALDDGFTACGLLETEDLKQLQDRFLQKRRICLYIAWTARELDNVGSAICVRDKESGAVLRGNSILKKNFSKEWKEGSFDRILNHGVPIGRAIRDMRSAIWNGNAV